MHIFGAPRSSSGFFPFQENWFSRSLSLEWQQPWWFTNMLLLVLGLLLAWPHKSGAGVFGKKSWAKSTNIYRFLAYLSSLNNACWSSFLNIIVDHRDIVLHSSDPQCGEAAFICSLFRNYIWCLQEKGLAFFSAPFGVCKEDGTDLHQFGWKWEGGVSVVNKVPSNTFPGRLDIAMKWISFLILLHPEYCSTWYIYFNA